MAKRKDVYPQFMSFTVVETALNTFTPIRVQMPIARRPGAKRITVIEVLKVMVSLRGETRATSDFVTVALSFRESNAADLLLYESANNWFWWERRYTVTTSGATVDVEPYEFRYDTGGGKGFLIATDSIFANIQGSSQATPVTAGFKILYRFVEVGLEEYIGIVQQQSSQTA